MERPWLNHYGKVPHHLEYPAGSMSDCVLQNVARFPQGEAISFMRQRISYAQMGREIERVARAFAAQGIKRGNGCFFAFPISPRRSIAFMPSIGWARSLG